MKKRNILFFSALLMVFSTNGFGREVTGAKKGPTPGNGTVANCSPATAAAELTINNTRALIQSGGDMWWDFNVSRYEIPSGSGRTSLFAGSLWLGGQDVSGQLKVAALRFRQNGNDFWTGPLSTTDAEISPETCREYDRHFETTRDEVAQFVAWYEAGQFDAENSTTTQQENFEGYQIPRIILEWPAHGRNFAPYNEDFFLAPFVDRNGDGFYDPVGAGDYPGYDLKGEADCSQRISNIYGDQNLWWVFNDKGNIHTETGAQSIGMEIRAQAFAFATNDEVNNMTFYNYELVNRSTFTLTDTYFGQWADGDLGNAQDDYVGCDVRRGLGYFYNGDGFDEDQGGNLGYGDQPPAIGIDFFQGPFQDNDGEDNPLTTDIQLAINQGGIPYAGIGIGYGDGIIDNERFGMRRFLFHNNGGANPNITDPTSGNDYYNYLRGIWLDGSQMVFGGNGYDPNNPTAILADYMFPGDSDPLNWGTRGVDPGDANWTEESAGNTPLDRRFAQSAGPFTLAPGAVNNITVGVVWARAASGGAFESVQAVRRADDKTQALFDSCFELLTGPDAPDVAIQELDREIILYLSNSQISNNFQEQFANDNPFQIAPDSVDTTGDGISDIALTAEEKLRYSTYVFQGYQIYQLADGSVAANELNDPDRARLVAQCDIEDDIVQLVNYTFDPSINGNIPQELVNGENEGIRHSFRINEDLFASGDNRLINHRQYYYMAIAYAYNLYGDDFGNLRFIEEDYDPNDPQKLSGQKEPYLASRKAASGGIRVYSAIPHKTQPEAGGSSLNAEYGDGVELIRVEGQGNGGFSLNIVEADVEAMFNDPNNVEGDVNSPWRISKPTYEASRGPVEVKVIDPLNLPSGDFTIAFKDSATEGDLSDAFWVLYGDGIDTVTASQSIGIATEELILDLGISLTVEQVVDPASAGSIDNGLIEGTIQFEDERRQWLSGVQDEDGNSTANWIRSGTNDDPDNPTFDDYLGVDDDQVYEGILQGTWAPFRLGTFENHGPLGVTVHALINNLNHLQSVDIVFTADKSKWTRCPVIEMQDETELAQGGVEKSFLRAGRSIDKDGNVADTSDTNPSTDPNHPNYVAATGMGWFPGYAINVETGERLNMAYGEDSWLAAENGADMQWNPTENLTEGFFGDVRFGGKHYVYVFRNNIQENDQVDPENRMPGYDGGRFMHDQLSQATSLTDEPMLNVYRSASWVGFPLLAENQTLLSNEATVKLRVYKPYRKYSSNDPIGPTSSLVDGSSYYVIKGPIFHDGQNVESGETFVANGTVFSSAQGDPTVQVSLLENDGLPLYNFNLDKLSPTINDASLAESALDLIKVVPNPYYAYSEYETDRLDNRIKITNLPQTCSITIYTVNGTLVRSFDKDDPTITSVDWDLKNSANIPIASGIYIIHVDVPGVGEKVLKWFGMLRPVDLDSF